MRGSGLTYNASRCMQCFDIALVVWRFTQDARSWLKNNVKSCVRAMRIECQKNPSEMIWEFELYLPNWMTKTKKKAFRSLKGLSQKIANLTRFNLEKKNENVKRSITRQPCVLAQFWAYFGMLYNSQIKAVITHTNFQSNRTTLRNILQSSYKMLWFDLP